LRYTKDENDFLEVKNIKNLSEIREKLMVDDPDAGKHQNRIITHGVVVFDNVTFKWDPYKPHKALCQLNFEIKSGEKIAVFGEIGAGKSCIIKLFSRYLDPMRNGTIHIDGSDITDCDLKDLRREMEVMTEHFFFKGTLKENLYLSTSAQDPGAGEVEAMDFEKFLRHQIGLKLRKEGLDFKVESNGNNLTFLEKQLISFARIFLDKKKLILMDDGFGDFLGLDSAKNLLKILFEEFRNSTMIVCTSNIATVLNFEKVMVLKYGRVIEFDTPANLQKMENGIFRSMVEEFQQTKMSRRITSYRCG
jgi:ABC-type multidrug transport system fused ATPase/permease subunit